VSKEKCLDETNDVISRKEIIPKTKKRKNIVNTIPEECTLYNVFKKDSKTQNKIKKKLGC
jgi:hypothetical protein